MQFTVSEEGGRNPMGLAAGTLQFLLMVVCWTFAGTSQQEAGCECAPQHKEQENYRETFLSIPPFTGDMADPKYQKFEVKTLLEVQKALSGSFTKKTTPAALTNLQLLLHESLPNLICLFCMKCINDTVTLTETAGDESSATVNTI